MPVPDIADITAKTFAEYVKHSYVTHLPCASLLNVASQTLVRKLDGYIRRKAEASLAAA